VLYYTYLLLIIIIIFIFVVPEYVQVFTAEIQLRVQVRIPYKCTCQQVSEKLRFNLNKCQFGPWIRNRSRRHRCYCWTLLG